MRAPGHGACPAQLPRCAAIPTPRAWGWSGCGWAIPAKADRSKVFDLPQYDDPPTAWSKATRCASSQLPEPGRQPVRSDPRGLRAPDHARQRRPRGDARAARAPGQQGRDLALGHRRPADPGVREVRQDFGGNVDRWHYYHYHAPCIAVIDFGSAATGTGAPEGHREDCIQMYACHFITPIDQTAACSTGCA